MNENNKGDGMLFSPEFKEVVRRLKDKEGELAHVVKVGRKSTEHFFSAKKQNRKIPGKIKKGGN